ncbi:unnamed protein product [Caenorhabditis angaria]|uniref:Uncharacterized protein n=1 Tax=Caenorhabditis angaria TaxID=860376 RepID=A0A9P1N3E6_9PELO|nr:unnamed protein product [Caenorhabditis angaria]
MSVRKDLTPSQTAGNTPVPQPPRTDNSTRTAKDFSLRSPIAPAGSTPIPRESSSRGATPGAPVDPKQLSGRGATPGAKQLSGRGATPGAPSSGRGATPGAPAGVKQLSGRGATPGAPAQQLSGRGATPGAPTSARGALKPNTAQRSARGAPPTAVAPEKPAEDGIIDTIWKTIITTILAISDFLNSIFDTIADICVKIWRVIMFVWRKPHHTKELITTTFHLIRVSYDAEIWSWTEIFEVIKNTLIAPMTKGPPPSKADKKAAAKKVK